MAPIRSPLLPPLFRCQAHLGLDPAFAGLSEPPLPLFGATFGGGPQRLVPAPFLLLRAIPTRPTFRAFHHGMPVFAKNRFGVFGPIPEIIRETFALPGLFLALRALLLFGLREWQARMGDILAAKARIDSGANVRTGVVGLLRGFITLRTAAKETPII